MITELDNFTMINSGLINCVLLSKWNYLRHKSGVYSDPCIQSQSEELRSFFDHKYLYRKSRKANFVRKSINKYLVKKEDILLRKNLANVVSKNLKILNGNHKHCCRANIVFFPVGHLISFSELRTPPAVSGTMAKSYHTGRIGKTRLKRLLFLRCHWLVSSTF
jgi:hypothetical protein